MLTLIYTTKTGRRMQRDALDMIEAMQDAARLSKTPGISPILICSANGGRLLRKVQPANPAPRTMAALARKVA